MSNTDHTSAFIAGAHRTCSDPACHGCLPIEMGITASGLSATDEIQAWEEWSNSIAEQMPEEYDGDEAQEAIIDRWISDLRTGIRALLDHDSDAEFHYAGNKNDPDVPLSECGECGGEWPCYVEQARVAAGAPRQRRRFDPDRRTGFGLQTDLMLGETP